MVHGRGRKRFALRGGGPFKDIREGTPGMTALGAGGHSPPPQHERIWCWGLSTPCLARGCVGCVAVVGGLVGVLGFGVLRAACYSRCDSYALWA